ncbi:MAG: hypothetical protein RMJ59_03780 [Candidatus Nitrosocaldus sp.]|nr:hypothetical protein [Candidatus Nitrosocaldus sp.]MCS7141842.1 hypothetical protein [Candidatus Nitrosocaldus sp.]MDW8000547.1 hypothetical protein [Candidatus Nitrosocaldus sp.]MDW8275486.1 hypothetical protein [Candidatus Nitrosocaldus sp.]
MVIVAEISIHILGMLLGLSIGWLTYRGYTITRSPTMLRLTVAFVSIGLGFMVDTVDPYIDGSYSMLSTTLSAVGYAFIALAYSVQKGFKYMVPLLTLLTFLIYPFFTISGNSLEYVTKAIAFMLIVYGSTQCMVISLAGRRAGSLMIASGIGLMAVAEFMDWYGMIFYSALYTYLADLLKVSGISLILLTIYMLIRSMVRVNA